MKTHTKTLLAALTATALVGSANAATIFAAEGFETDLGNWNVGSRGTVSNNDTGLYNFTGPVNSPDAATNFATTGTGAFRLENGFATLVSDVFDASLGGATESITLSFDQTAGYRTQSTRFVLIEYSNDNGASWFRVAGFASAASGSGSVTFTEGGSSSTTGVFNTSNLNRNLGGTGGTAVYAGETFGSQSLIRVIFDTKNDNRSIFVDNIEATTTAPIPEPGSLVLLAAGGLLVASRRRRS